MIVVMVPGAEEEGVAVTEGVAVMVIPEETVTELDPVGWAPPVG
jgi:hypothetical protein